MDAVIEYVREWCLESSKNGLERYIEEKQQETAEEVRKKVSEEVREEAAKEVSFNVAKRMLEDNFDIKIIMDVTGLTKKQVLSLKQMLWHLFLVIVKTSFMLYNKRGVFL